MRNARNCLPTLVLSWELHGHHLKKRSTLGRTTEQGIVVPRTSEGSHPLGDGASRCDPRMSVSLHAAVGAVNLEKNLRATVKVEAEQQNGALTIGAKLQAEKTGTLVLMSKKAKKEQKRQCTAVPTVAKLWFIPYHAHQEQCLAAEESTRVQVFVFVCLSVLSS